MDWSTVSDDETFDGHWPDVAPLRLLSLNKVTESVSDDVAVVVGVTSFLTLPYLLLTGFSAFVFLSLFPDQSRRCHCSVPQHDSSSIVVWKSRLVRRVRLGDAFEIGDPHRDHDDGFDDASCPHHLLFFVCLVFRLPVVYHRG